MSDSTKIAYVNSDNQVVVIESEADGNKLPCKSEIKA